MTNFKLFTTEKTLKLANAVSEILNIKAETIYTQKFSDGEVFVRFDQTLQGMSVFFISDMQMPYENMFEYMMAIDAAKRSSAKEVVCIIPYLPHSRQERRDSEQVSIAARLTADFIEKSGADRVITIEMHTESIEGFYKIPVVHLAASQLFFPHIQSRNLNNICVCSPDIGGIKRVKRYKKFLGAEMAIINKERLLPNQISSMEIIGYVKDRNVVIIDDMIDTSETIIHAADLIMEKGAVSVSAYAAHGILSGDAIANIENSKLEKVYVTDTIIKTKPSEKIEIISCSPLIARAMENIMHR